MRTAPGPARDPDQTQRPRIAGPLVEQPADRDVDLCQPANRGEAADRKTIEQTGDEVPRSVAVQNSHIVRGDVRIGIQTWGSEGDIRPFVALGHALAKRGTRSKCSYRDQR